MARRKLVQKQKTSIGIAIIRKLEELQQSILEEQKRLSGIYPEWDLQKDIRNTVFFRFIHGLNSVKLSIIFIERHLKYENWWHQNFPYISPSDKRNAVLEFEKSTKHKFGMSLFLLVENAFRILLRAVDPLACENATAAFESVYRCLLQSKLSGVPPDAIELLNLVRLVRNTIHNDGVYFHRSGKDTEAVYKGVRYPFKYGRPVEFVTWEFLLMLANDIRDLLVRVISDKAIAKMDHLIADPFC